MMKKSPPTVEPPLGAHVWFAVGAAAIAIVLSGVIAYSAVDAEARQSHLYTTSTQPATKTDVERILKRIDQLEQDLKAATSTQ